MGVRNRGRNERSSRAQAHISGLTFIIAFVQPLACRNRRSEQDHEQDACQQEPKVGGLHTVPSLLSSDFKGSSILTKENWGPGKSYLLIRIFLDKLPYII